MMGNVSLLTQVEPINPVSVELPNGMFQVAKVQGKTNLGSNVKLSNVLYVSNFHCNLVSIAQLCEELRCIMIFTDELCMI